MKLTWLLKTHGYCELLNKVIKLYEPSEQCQLAVEAFPTGRDPWCDIVCGAEYSGNATPYRDPRTWEGRSERLNIRDFRMRPDRDFPTYVEDGELFKNTYRPPVHKGTGDVETFKEFIKHLLPVEFEPGVVLRLARLQMAGAGYPRHRGGYGRIGRRGSDLRHRARHALRHHPAAARQRLRPANRLRHHDRQVVAERVHRLARRAHPRPWSTKAKDTADASKWSERRAVWERLKSIIEPRAVMASFTLKNGQMFYGLCFAGYIIATNNLDAIQIPPGDRRFGCLANGERMTDELASRLQAWMDQPGNVAALARWLEQRDISKFDPFEAPVTLTKTAMQEMSRTDRDEAFLAVRKLFGKSALFTAEQFHQAMKQTKSQAGVAKERMTSPRGSTPARQATTSNNEEFRMPKRKGDGKRPLLLRWRDYDGPVVEKVEDAQAQVAITGKLIDAETDEAVAEILRGLRVLHGEAGD